MKNGKIILLISGLVYVFYHLSTLKFAPLPWFDEVCFASMTLDFLHHHTFFDTSRSISLPDQILAYGPVYFVFQSWIVGFLGFNMFSFRILNMLCGFVDLYLLFNLFRQFKIKDKVVYLAIALIALDPSFNMDLHSGRMEFVALLFVLLSFTMFLSISLSPGGTIGRSVLSGVFLALALLTTPRVIFLSSFYIFHFIYDFFNRGKGKYSFILKYVIIFFVVFAMYLVWMFYAFGGPTGYYHYYVDSPLLMKHVGYHDDSTQFNFKRYYLYLNIYILTLLGLLVWKKQWKDIVQIILFCLPPIVFFIIIVNSASDFYNALIIPFKATLIAVISNTEGIKSRILKYANVLILVFFGGIFVFKSAGIFADLEYRNPTYFESKICHYLTPKTPVFADYQYFYMVANTNGDYEAVANNGTLSDQVDFLRKNKVPVIILNKYTVAQHAYPQAYVDSNYVMVDQVEKKGSSPLSRLFKLLPAHVNDDYACCIFQLKSTAVIQH